MKKNRLLEALLSHEKITMCPFELCSSVHIASYTLGEEVVLCSMPRFKLS
jgi:hypothetical protein